MLEVELSPDHRRKLELVARHREATVVEFSDTSEGKCLALVRKS